MVELPHCYPFAPKLPNLPAPMPNLKGSLEDVDNYATRLSLNIPVKQNEDQSYSICRYTLLKWNLDHDLLLSVDL